MTGPTTSIAVIDDHKLFRAGLIELLNSVAEFVVCGEGASGLDAVVVADKKHPDVMLLDIEMPEPGGPATIRDILRASPDTRVVVLTIHDDPELVRTVVEAGAAGFLLKSAGRDELMAAINAVHRDTSSVLVCVSRTTFVAITRGTVRSIAGELLSARETEVVRQLANGGSNRDIANALSITEATVKRHLANVYVKLGARSRIDAVRKASKHGIAVNT